MGISTVNFSDISQVFSFLRQNISAYCNIIMGHCLALILISLLVAYASLYDAELR